MRCSSTWPRFTTESMLLEHKKKQETHQEMENLTKNDAYEYFSDYLFD